MIEVRPTGQSPMAVTHQGPSIHETSAGALQKMLSKLQSSMGRRDNTKGGHSIRDLDLL
ncbi:hypothetical protein HUK65_17840 [Rhodobacteraceae bacterium 2376]|uniref:Uncharacterized protein n=2 Tax=Rhabdonatronobacter sediminivivens TaxID=2743469 RepID=A0A7Z0L026_9RHOB|nr:hypothetical protein [Rhabdonatronobacter sediminivivens]